MAAASVQWNSDDINENVYVCKKKKERKKERIKQIERERERKKNLAPKVHVCVCVRESQWGAAEWDRVGAH